MLYLFPTLDTLRLVITTGDVPPDVSMQPAAFAEDEEGPVWVQPSVALPRKAQNALKRLGVEIAKDVGHLVDAVSVDCWPQILPLERDTTNPVPTPQTPVLFELPDPELLPELVAEMLRLGNDRQSFRFVKGAESNRVLLRVVGPPYYSLLRALEREGRERAPVAYLERIPRVWVELGHTHPLIDKFKPGAGQLRLLRPPRSWTTLDDAPFQDIYEILDFALPAAPVSWKEGPARDRFKVALRLVASSSMDPPHLWVLRDDAVAQLDQLVNEAKDALLERLAFAVAESDGQTTIVLRVRPSKYPPPALELKGAQAFRPVQKMHNLFLPDKRDLQPKLRRDVVRQLLADDPDRIVWLWPHEDGSFTPESLPDAVFRPLHDWVDYVLDREQQALQTWMQSAQFDFESFICGEDERPDAPKPPPRERKGGPKGPKAEDVAVDDAPAPAAPTTKKGKRKDVSDTFDLLPQAKPSELQLRLTELENQFITHDGPLDAQERQTLWPEMATLKTALGDASDAAVCWTNALWETDGPVREWTKLWLHAEKVKDHEPSAAEIDRLLRLLDPTAAEARALVACIVGAVAAGTASAVLGPRLNALRQCLEKHEKQVGVRASWLAWHSLARLSAGDVLGLARARDRLLERLLSEGLHAERDLPSFLRFAGQQSSDYFRAVRDRFQHLHSLADQWINYCYSHDKALEQKASEPTRAYAHLTFAFGLARLGEASQARQLQARAADVLGQTNDEVHSFLLQAYTYRIQQVLEGKPHLGPLPADHLEYLTSEIKDNFQKYKVDRLRCHSRILEPQEKVDPYRRYTMGKDDLSRELLALTELTDRQQLATRFGKLIQTTKQPRSLLEILKTAMQLAPRVSEAFTMDVLDRLGPLLDALPPIQDYRDLEDRAVLIERGLFLAAHFDRAEQVQAFVARFLKLLESQRGEGATAARALDGLTGQCFRGLRKLGLRDETDRLLQQMASLVIQGQDLATLRGRHGKEWPTVLRTLLQIAAGWFYFGRTEKAMPILAEAYECLFAEDWGSERTTERTKLACAYATTLGQAPVELALHKLAELFQRLGVLADRFTTNTHYSRSQLEVIEAVVLAVVSDDFALSQGARRWLDEDEYLVRRRIHRDLRQLMAQSGL
jgi:hypothetical protein